MNTLIIYGATEKLTPAHQLVFGLQGHKQYWIRIIPTKDDIDLALDRAKPLSGETVLNTVSL